jgi:GT2 family glycosyltransferase
MIGVTLSQPLSRVGVVVIGRNEAFRLPAALASIPPQVAATVYVDSGSSDDSVALARRARVEVVELDRSTPFTASRGRNAGVRRIRQLAPEVQLVQFLDGDCSLVSGWLETGARVLEDNQELVAVVGRLHELHPERSIYNRLCEMEWAAPASGSTLTFGGIVMMRVDRLLEVGGWNEAVIAAEDDELALRLRARGGYLLRLPDSMAHHDAAIMRFGQWWRRSVRTGHAYAQVQNLHRAGCERYFRWETRRACLWGLGVPVASLALSIFSHGTSLLLWGLYPLQVVRLALRRYYQGASTKDALLWASATVVSRFAEAQGMIKYYMNRWRKRRLTIIEYKGAG